MALLDQFPIAKFGIGICGARAGHQLAVVDAQTHGAAHVGNVALVRHQIDDRVLGADVELGAVRLIVCRIWRANSMHMTCMPRHSPR